MQGTHRVLHLGSLSSDIVLFFGASDGALERRSWCLCAMKRQDIRQTSPSISLVALPAWTELLLACLPGRLAQNASLHNTTPTCYLAEVKTSMSIVGAHEIPACCLLFMCSCGALKHMCWRQRVCIWSTYVRCTLSSHGNGSGLSYLSKEHDVSGKFLLQFTDETSLHIATGKPRRLNKDLLWSPISIVYWPGFSGRVSALGRGPW